MKTAQAAEVKIPFSSLLRDMKAGKYGKEKTSPKRQLGTLEGKMSVSFSDDYKMTDEELINL